MPYVDSESRAKLTQHVEDFPSFEGDEGLGNLADVVCFISGQAVISGSESTKYSDPDYSQLPWCPTHPEIWG